MKKLILLCLLFTSITYSQTRSIVPRADHQGYIGKPDSAWLGINADSLNGIGIKNGVGIDSSDYFALRDTNLINRPLTLSHAIGLFAPIISPIFTGVANFGSIHTSLGASFMGNVGIGTTGPQAPLDIRDSLYANLASLELFDPQANTAGAGGGMFMGGIYTGSSYTEWAGIKANKDNGTDFDGGLDFYTRSNARGLAKSMSILSTGNVGIGYTTPTTTRFGVKNGLFANIHEGINSTNTTVEKIDSSGYFLGANYGSAVIGAGDSVQVTIAGLTVATGGAVVSYKAANAATLTKIPRWNITTAGKLSIFADEGTTVSYWIGSK